MGWVTYENRSDVSWGNQSRPTGSAVDFVMKGDEENFLISPTTLKALNANFSLGNVKAIFEKAKEQFALPDGHGSKLAECQSTFSDPVTGKPGLDRTYVKGVKLPKTVDMKGIAVVIDDSPPKKAEDNATKQKLTAENTKMQKDFKKLGKRII
tara:strand:- start:563 stop:1021 length:459 start_codon:yes stop_codon:yes gene_type:complete